MKSEMTRHLASVSWPLRQPSWESVTVFSNISRALDSRSQPTTQPLMAMLSLFAATPSLAVAPTAAAPILRAATPVMQVVQGAGIDTGRMTGRAVPTQRYDYDDSILVQGGSLRTWS